MRRFVWLAMIATLPLHATLPVKQSPEKKPQSFHLLTAEPMNGISPKEYGAFWKKWRLVNVRYRKDTDEQRFVYANAVAWKAMEAGEKKFPNGSVFAKIGFYAIKDPRFPDSLQPTRANRIQYMKKNVHDYPETNGWGYAIYVPESKPDKIEGSAVGISGQMLCHSCHNLAKDNDYVFTSPALKVGDPIK